MTATFPPVPASIPLARRFVLERADPDGAVDPGVLSLLTSELVTNAVCHANTPFVVDVERTGEDEVQVSVTDGSARAPRLIDSSPEAPVGRGLFFVASYARAWGFEPVTNGKRVWFVAAGGPLTG